MSFSVFRSFIMLFIGFFLSNLLNRCIMSRHAARTSVIWHRMQQQQQQQKKKKKKKVSHSNRHSTAIVNHTTYHHTVVGRNRRRDPFVQLRRLASGKGWFVVFQIHCQLNRANFWRKDQFSIEPIGQADTVVQVVFEHGEGVPQGHQMGGVFVAFVK